MKRAFTLIELMVCILIATVLATLAVVNLRSGRQAASFNAVINELITQDRLMRDRAQRQGHPGEMLFDIAGNKAARVEWIAKDRSSKAMLESLSAPTRIEYVRVFGEAGDGNVQHVLCSKSGRTPSYAVLVTSGTKRQWLLFSGLTGNVDRLDHETQVQDIFRELAAKRDDAD